MVVIYSIEAENVAWYNIFTQLLLEKNLEWLYRMTTTFQYRIKQKEGLTGNPVKLGTQNVASFRDMDPAFVHKMACTFFATMPIIEAKFGRDSEKTQELIAKFRRGVLDKQIAEKVKAMDKDVELKTFSFLLTETDTIEVLVSRSNQVDTISAASQAIVNAEFNFAKAQLEVEGRTFDEFMKRNIAAVQLNEERRVSHLEDRHLTVEAEVDKLLETTYPTRPHKDMVGAGTFVSTAISNYCTAHGQVKEFLLKVAVYNLNYVGSRWGHIISSVTSSAATLINEAPERTVALVVCPLFPARNEADDMDTIAEQVREHFKDGELQVVTRMVNIEADESTCQSNVAATYRAIMVCSNQSVSEVSGGKTIKVYKSRFVQKSILWTRRRCSTQFTMLTTVQYIDPIADAISFRAKEVDERQHLNAEKRMKQLLTSESMWGCLFESLFQGLSVDKSVHAAVIDYTPYDGSLQKFMIGSNYAQKGFPGLPTFLAIQPSWYAASEIDRNAIAKYLIDDLKTFLMDGMKEGRFANSVVAAFPKVPPSLMSVPALDDDQFKHSKPDLETGVCRVKQDFINKWGEVALCKEEFKEIIQKWNEVRNPGGETWKGNKRVISVAEQGSEVSEENVPMHQSDGTGPSTLTEAQAKYGAPVIIPDKEGWYDHVFFPDTGAYALSIKQDCQIRANDYLVLIKGTFETGEPAKTIRDEKKLDYLDWEGANNMDDKYSFTHDIKGKQFKKGPTSLGEFVRFLETCGKVKAGVNQLGLRNLSHISMRI